MTSIESQQSESKKQVSFSDSKPINVAAYAVTNGKHTLMTCDISVRNERPVTRYFKPAKALDGSINKMAIHIGSNDCDTFRHFIESPETPNFSGSLKLLWNGKEYAHSVDGSNKTGHNLSAHSVFELKNQLFVESQQADTMTFFFLSQLPGNINKRDLPEIQNQILSDLFDEWQTLTSTKHVHLFVLPHIYEHFSKVIANFDSYFASVYSNQDMITHFIGMYFGKNLQGIVPTSEEYIALPPIQAIKLSSRIRSNGHSFSQFAIRSGNRVQFNTVNEGNSFGTCNVLVESDDAGMPSIALVNTSEQFPITYYHLDNSDTLISAILFNNTATKIKERFQSNKDVCHNMLSDFAQANHTEWVSYMMKSPLSPFIIPESKMSTLPDHIQELYLWGQELHRANYVIVSEFAKYENEKERKCLPSKESAPLPWNSLQAPRAHPLLVATPSFSVSDFGPQ